ncbi:hypothetical protein [Mucilaginibacter pineti]|nr:hypothetical protein [Mucilaginibacter pineti]
MPAEENLAASASAIPRSSFIIYSGSAFVQPIRVNPSSATGIVATV